MRSVENGQCRVERLGRAHDGLRQRWLGLVVTTDVSRRTLDSDQFAHYGLLLFGQGLGENGEGIGQLSVDRLRGELLGPIEGQVEVAAPIVNATQAAAR